MKPNEIQKEIARIAEHAKTLMILLNDWAVRSSQEDYDERMVVQDAIIAEAEKVKADIQLQHDKAPKEMNTIERSLRYRKKRLAILKNYRKIEKLKEIQHKLAQEMRDV